MLRKCLSGFFVGLLVFAANLQITRAQSVADIERNRVERIKTNVYRLEDSRKTKVVVKLRSGAKLKGYITKIGEDAFDLTNYKTSRTTAIAYRDIAQVKAQDSSTKGMKTALAVIGVAAIVVLVITFPRGRSPICPLGCRSF